MLWFGSSLAVVLYVLPFLWVVGIASCRDTTPARSGLLIPATAAFDLAAILLLARLVPLEWAAFGSRLLWVLGLVFYMVRRRVRPGELFRGLPHRIWGRALLAALFAAAASLLLSEPYWLWDREWHVPFVSLLRAEHVPFANVYEPDRIVRYHVAGDALAAVIQAFSLGIIHSSRALSLTHDILFGLLGCTVGFLFQAYRFNRWLAVAVSPLAVVLAGPIALHRGPEGAFQGYSDLNNLTLSFRPHTVLAGLLIVGFSGTVLARLEGRGWPTRQYLAILFSCVAILAIADESSTILLLGGLGAAWLVDHRALHEHRWRGLIVLVGLVATVWLSNIAFGGVLSPGGPINKTEWIAPRVPGFNTPALPIADARAPMSLAVDLGLEALIAIALVVTWLRGPTRGGAAFLAFLFSIGAVSVALFLCMQVNGIALESHRFLTVVRFAFPLSGVLALPREPRGSFSQVLTTMGLGAAAVSTLGYVFVRLPEHQAPYAYQNQYETNCWKEMGARPGRRPVVSYINQSIWYLYAGCHPVYAPAQQTKESLLPSYFKAGWASYGATALHELDSEMVPAGASLRAICPRNPAGDPICAHAEQTEQCKDLGTRVRACTLTGADRQQLLTQR